MKEINLENYNYLGTDEFAYEIWEDIETEEIIYI